jgi:hypothetical protein
MSSVERINGASNIILYTCNPLEALKYNSLDIHNVHIIIYHITLLTYYKFLVTNLLTYMMYTSSFTSSYFSIFLLSINFTKKYAYPLQILKYNYFDIQDVHIIIYHITFLTYYKSLITIFLTYKLYISSSTHHLSLIVFITYKLYKIYKQ